MLHNRILKKFKRNVKAALHTAASNFVNHEGDKGITALGHELNTKLAIFRAKLDKNNDEATPSLDDILNITFETGDTTALRLLCQLADDIDGIHGNKKSAFDLMNDLSAKVSNSIHTIHKSAADGLVTESEQRALQTSFTALRKAIDMAEDSMQVGKVRAI